MGYYFLKKQSYSFLAKSNSEMLSKEQESRKQTAF